MRAPRLITRLALLLALTAAAGCFQRRSRGSRPPAAAERASPTVVRVENLAFNDATVYVVRGGAQRIRLGFAGGNRTTVLTIPASVVPFPTPLRFIADPIGSNRRPTGSDINVSPGDEVLLQIPPS